MKIIKLNEDIIAFLGQNHADIREKIKKYGALLFRGSSLLQLSDLEKIANRFLDKNVVEYNYGSSPRTKLLGNVYTSTEYPNNLMIQLHNENSYTDNYPSFLFFYCLIPSEDGGETPIVDSALIYESIDKNIRDEFETKRVMYTRNYTNTFDLTWQQSFATEKKEDVEKYCKFHDIDFEWITTSHLRTRQICDAVKMHHGKKIWFNQAHLFNQENNDEIFKDFYKDMSPIEYPRNSFFGDGSIIPKEYIDHIKNIYTENMILETWQKGDLMILDNLAFAHGRMPYKGNRRILVCMG